jgi:hypothetical protein
VRGPGAPGHGRCRRAARLPGRGRPAEAAAAFGSAAAPMSSCGDAKPRCLRRTPPLGLRAARTRSLRAGRGRVSAHRRGGCDLVITFFDTYLPSAVLDLPDRIPRSLIPPSSTLTEEQQFFAGGWLSGVGLLEDSGDSCAVTIAFETSTGSVPWYCPSEATDSTRTHRHRPESGSGQRGWLGSSIRLHAWGYSFAFRSGNFPLASTLSLWQTAARS